MIRSLWRKLVALMVTNYALWRKIMELVVKNQVATNQVATNPFRPGTKLYNIFQFLSDGHPHSLNAITEAVYYPGAAARPRLRRRTSSAIRTVRANLERRNVGSVHYKSPLEHYRMVIR